MPFADETTRAAYREAWEAWQKQLEHLHRVFLDDESIKPDQLKGLLNRESRAKDRYDTARLRLLGLEPAEPPSPGANPFR
ncbi:MAG TPA: hypothetical protein VJQ83_08265 [Tepidiformaceae bacterium]|nr:hypothetical protein [Tepidiformaceae bacterium]